MLECDALIVGGGPAGSTCARALRQAGWNVVVMDRATFPRDKVCAGWVTPHVLRAIELDPAEYRRAGLTMQEITGFRTSVEGRPPVETQYGEPISYAIRRCEFDTFLLRRSGAQVLEGTALTSLHRDGDDWVANGSVRAPIVIGAGGHFCPVARHLRNGEGVPEPVVAKEAEFILDEDSPVAPQVPELFFCRDLEGYAWCVRKGTYVNVGIGRRVNERFGAHVEAFKEFLERSGKAPGASRAKWKGHAYLACGTGSRRLVGEGMLLIGDAAGLAYPESGEGIRPAVESGLLAARTVIAAGRRAPADALRGYEDELRRRYPASIPSRGAWSRGVTAVGRLLLRSRLFTRHVVIDRWFLRIGSMRSAIS
ncbi:MAG TPA: NAD(P)/FAD-dependent oxidoreductase [Vicinamibacterales bacterium]|nr:NAD(P)/FAD-dependent oxidoreductase [Vicinamibacterales bacterium]